HPSADGPGSKADPRSVQRQSGDLDVFHIRFLSRLYAARMSQKILIPLGLHALDFVLRKRRDLNSTVKAPPSCFRKRGVRTLGGGSNLWSDFTTTSSPNPIGEPF